MDSKIRVAAAAACAVLSAVAATAGRMVAQEFGVSDVAQAVSPDCAANVSDACAAERLHAGRKLFDVETFGGNGRTCRTCHSKRTGTFSPEDALDRLAEDATDPLFVHDGLDDGLTGTTRITQHATVRIEIALPPDVVLADDPGRRSVILNRGTPTTMNTPALDRLLMYDTREPNLQRQALNAIRGHAQNTREPAALELDLIKEFQQKDAPFFSSEALMAFANGGPPPQLPECTTESERRGRAMFDDVPFDPSTATTARGICNVCHSGPMLNQFARVNPVGPPGGRRADIGVSQRNLLGNPLYTFLVTNADGNVVEVRSPDPGDAAANPARATARLGISTASEVIVRGCLQDSDALGCRQDRTVFSRQLGQDARGRRRALRVLLRKWRLANQLQHTGRDGYGCVPETAALRESVLSQTMCDVQLLQAPLREVLEVTVRPRVRDAAFG